MQKLTVATLSLILSLLACTFLHADDGVTQDDMGILHGKTNRIEQPVSSVPLKGIESVKQMWVTPDAKSVVMHEWAHDKANAMVDRLIVVDTGTGKIRLTLNETQNIWKYGNAGAMSTDSKLFFTTDPASKGLVAYDLETGKKAKSLPAPGDREVGLVQFSGSDRAAAVTEDGGVVIWDLSTGKSNYVKLDQPAGSHYVVFPLAGRDELLMINMTETPAAAGGAAGRKSAFSILDPKTGKPTPISTISGNCDVRVTADGSKAHIFRQEDPQETVWTGIETWDLKTLKQTSKQALNPRLSSIGLKETADGNTLFLHEYMVQPVVAWDLSAGKLNGIIAPKDGGCAAFDIIPDGKKLVAYVGPWVQGTLDPRDLVVYDTSSALSKGK